MTTKYNIFNKIYVFINNEIHCSIIIEIRVNIESKRTTYLLKNMTRLFLEEDIFETPEDLIENLIKKIK